MPTEQETIRKLRAILSADVKGYSLLMADNEAQTIQTLKAYRQIMFDLIVQHSGRVIDSPGDNLLAEFGSAVDAIESAVDIQKRLKKENAGFGDDKKLQFRIGINIGDVVQDEDRIYGSGVNIAARIEGLADPGGICISRNAYDHIKDKLKLGYEYLGQHEVKNIKHPVRVYRVLSDPDDAGKLIGKEPKLAKKKWVLPLAVVAAIIVTSIVWHFYQSTTKPDFEPTSVEKMAFPLPEKPSIAVLAFDNMSSDPDQEYFSDGLSEEIITALSKIPYLFVIARNSSFSYKGKPVKIRQVAEELGVRYVLEGSVRRAGGRVRVTAQLIDAIKGHHLWAERYERELKDTFALQDEITGNILSALAVKLTRGEQATIRPKGTDNLEAHLKILQAIWYGYRMTKEGHFRARQLAEEVMALDPEYAASYIILGHCHIREVFFGWSKSRKESLEQAFELAQKAISLDESSPSGYRLLSSIYMFKKQYEKAIAEAERSVALDPNGADAYSLLGSVLQMVGRKQEAIALLEKAIRLNPMAPSIYFRRLGSAYRDIGRYEEAIVQLKKAINLSPDSLYPHTALASTYSLAGRDDEARAEVSEVLRIQPKISLESLAKRVAYKNKADIDRIINALHKAGLPDKPPLPLPDKPSIAVLAFDNMSGDPSQEYFSDGITENIITALSKVGALFVISRNSSFTYKEKPVKVQQVSKELGVRYVVEGSVQKSGDRVRITAQLIDAKDGQHLWAEKYDRDLKDIFALQDEITKRIITALQVKLTDGEQARIRAEGTDNLEAYLKVLEARELYSSWKIGDNHKARQLLEKALKLDPQYVYAYVGMGFTHVLDVYLDPTKSKKNSITRAFELSKKALSIDNSSGYAHMLSGNVNYLKKLYKKGIGEYEKAVELYPNSADSHAFLARGLDLIGKTEEAILMSKKAMRLNPIPPNWYIVHRTAMYRNIKNYKEALVWAEKAVQRQPQNLIARINLCSVYSLTERMEEARLEANEIMKLNPKFSLVKLENSIPYKNPEVKKRYILALRNAGLPD